MPEPNFTKLHQISLICLAQYCALMCCFVLYLLDICKTDGNANFKNFSTEQKVDFIIKVTEQQVPPLL